MLEAVIDLCDEEDAQEDASSGPMPQGGGAGASPDAASSGMPPPRPLPSPAARDDATRAPGLNMGSGNSQARKNFRNTVLTTFDRFRTHPCSSVVPPPAGAAAAGEASGGDATGAAAAGEASGGDANGAQSQQAPLYSAPFLELPVDKLIDRQLYGLFAEYLASHHIPYNGRRNDPDPMGEDTCIAYLRGLLVMARDKISDDCHRKEELVPVHVQMFFGCLSGAGEPAQWLDRVQCNIRSLTFDRLVATGKDPQGSVRDKKALYRGHIEKLVQQYSRFGSQHNDVLAAERKFTILVTRLCAGRAAEQAFLDVARMHYDTHFHCVVAKLPMPKVKRCTPALARCVCVTEALSLRSCL